EIQQASVCSCFRVVYLPHSIQSIVRVAECFCKKAIKITSGLAVFGRLKRAEHRPRKRALLRLRECCFKAASKTRSSKRPGVRISVLEPEISLVSGQRLAEKRNVIARRVV